MSYNIMNKRASFQGTISGSIEDMVDNHTTQTVNGQKTFTDLSASTSVLVGGHEWLYGMQGHHTSDAFT